MEEPKRVYRKDYAPTPFSISDIYLSFNLNDGVTRVSSKLSVVPNYAGENVPAMELDGSPDVKLVGIKVSGEDWAQDKYSLTPKMLTLTGLPKGNFELEVDVEIVPEKNTKLEGLYRTSGNYCSQCEAQGFRNITYSYDRPDVMSKYTVRIEGDKENNPVMLSNGNLKEQRDLDNGRHYTIWEDPFLKPSYLFALVAGKLAVHKDTFTTMSGKVVNLRIFAQEHNIRKVPFAMESLKQAMKWDEERFGLEYDLDLFNIVAVDDFNMGAMENKSLNVFNAICVLATSDTATDSDFLNVQRVVGHEYFHNWTGNRVTCRDWFQLTLKEGLTVFRDQEFSSDLNSEPVKRISDVNFVRSAQFTEDAGPMAHPIRPDSYLKMDNFYTGTVYKKGAEIIRLYKTILGVDGFRKGMDLYFQRHDGQAVTCDDFLAAMADANKKELSGLQNWYSQAGTPLLRISLLYNEEAHTLILNASQSTPATPGQSEKAPVLIPIAVGLLGPDGKDMPVHVKGGAIIMGSTAVLEFNTEEATFVFEKVSEKPVASIMRGFSAPVTTVIDGQTDEELLFLFANDSDPFNRWDAGQKYLKNVLIKLYNAAIDNPSESVEVCCKKAGGIPSRIVQAFRAVLLDKSIDGAFAALATTLPAQPVLIRDIKKADPIVLVNVCAYMRRAIATELESDLKIVLESNSSPPGEPYNVKASSVGKRSIRNEALSFLSTLNKQEYNQECLKRFREATNMTDSLAALSCIMNNNCPEREKGLVEFEEKWKHDNLVMLKWLSMQAMCNLPGNLDAVRKLTEHPCFLITNPNCNYTLCGGFAASPVNFHNIDGSGYEFLADHLLKVDALSPIAASRIVNIFSRWRLYDSTRQSLIKGQLERLMSTGKLSENTFEIVSKSLE